MDCKTAQGEEQRRSPQTLVATADISLVNVNRIFIYQPCVINYRYVLLKEKNMLLTLQQEARRKRVQMPSPERLRKVSVIFRKYL